MELLLAREPSSAASTLGLLFVDGLIECCTLEDVVREIPGRPVAEWKIPKITAIPAGTYRVQLTHSPRFNRILPELVDVPDYTGVRIHPGNRAEDTDGCILTGQKKSKDYIYDSQKAFNALFAKMVAACAKNEEIWITVKNP